jgi:cell wall assembly regulator SMI1
LSKHATISLVLLTALFIAAGCTAKRDPLVDTLTQIKTWLRTNAAPLVDLLNPPATEKSIALFEKRTKLKLPPDVKRLYLIHNGESEKSDGIFGCWKMLSLSEIEQELKLTDEKGIIPLFRSGGGDLYYVKTFDPAKPDYRLFEYWNDERTQVNIVSDSVEKFLHDFNHQLQNGQFVYKPEDLAALIDRDDL